MLDLKVYRSSQFSEEIPPEGEFEIVAIQDIMDKHIIKYE